MIPVLSLYFDEASIKDHFVNTVVCSISGDHIFPALPSIIQASMHVPPNKSGIHVLNNSKSMSNSIFFINDGVEV